MKMPVQPDYAYIRRSYGVSPARGCRVHHQVTKRDGTIQKPKGDPQYVDVLFDGDKFALPCHPTELDYLS